MTLRSFTNEPIQIEGATDVLIENNRFERINSGTTRDTHAIAIPTNGQRITIRNNVFVDNGADGVQLGDTGANIRDIAIVGNEFRVTQAEVGRTDSRSYLLVGSRRNLGGASPCQGDRGYAASDAAHNSVQQRLGHWLRQQSAHRWFPANGLSAPGSLVEFPARGGTRRAVMGTVIAEL